MEQVNGHSGQPLAVDAQASEETLRFVDDARAMFSASAAPRWRASAAHGHAAHVARAGVHMAVIGHLDKLHVAGEALAVLDQAERLPSSEGAPSPYMRRCGNARIQNSDRVCREGLHENRATAVAIHSSSGIAISYSFTQEIVVEAVRLDGMSSRCSEECRRGWARMPSA